MRIFVFADLHFDMWLRSDRNPLAPVFAMLETADAVIIAGDVANNPEHGWPNVLGWLKRLVDPKKIWLIPGNHDYYGFRLDGDDRLREIAEANGANFLQKDVLELGGVRFLCCTLWSDFEMRGRPREDMQAAARGLNDYRLIRRHEGGPVIVPEGTARLHADHLAWLKARLAEPYEGRTAVITHHVPSPSVSGKIDEFSPAFGSDLDELILKYQPDLWLCGHTHRHLRAMVGRTEIRNVSLGYPSEVPSFLHESVLEAGWLDTEQECGRLPVYD